MIMLRRKPILTLLLLVLVTFIVGILLVKYSYNNEDSTTLNSDISKRDDEQLIKSGDNTDTSSAVTTRNNGSGQDGTDDPEYGYDCYPVGPCDLCTSFEQKTEAICQKTGNKEPINCKPLDPPPSKSLGPKPSFRSCVVVKRLEKSRFFKFQTFNIFIAIGTLLLIYWRRRKLQYFFQRKIARRIAQV